jgi:TATA-binding protein-associated factor
MNVKILLVTTKVGGFGLNLPAANVVIMFDHDYNPTVDMQAIDRAHRLGQKNVVNVYRLITKDTLE